jgi:hypothetical protein
MCIMCVEIMRGHITVKDGLRNMREASGLRDDNSMWDLQAKLPDDIRHVGEILDADRSGNVERVAELVKAGYKKERWL